MAETYQIEMLVLQPTSFCNIDCSYCYLPNRSNKSRMSDKTLDRVFDQIFSSRYLSDKLTILWHAGEPLVLGTEYYENALNILKKRQPPDLFIRHSLQTNGILINQKWVNFFVDNNINVGVSLDGPIELHDRFRQTRGRHGTFEQVMRGIRLLQAHGIPFHVITVLTRDSLFLAHELFEFYVENGIRQVGFNIEEVEGVHMSSSLQVDGIDDDMHRFFDEIYTECESRPGYLHVREFQAAFHSIVEPATARYGNPLAEPMRTLSIGVNGEVSTFSPELLGYSSDRHGSFAFGNIHECSIDSLVHDQKFLLVNSEIKRGLKRCEHECQYFEICRGGSPVNKLFENGTFDSTDTLFCRLVKKAVVDVVLSRLERKCYRAGAAPSMPA